MKRRSSIPHRRAKVATAILVLTLGWAVAPSAAQADDNVREDNVDMDVHWPLGTTADSAVEGGVRIVWDVLFWRPLYIVQLVGGVVALPVALPLSTMVGSWRDSIDICVTGPAEMAFGRPLGE